MLKQKKLLGRYTTTTELSDEMYHQIIELDDMVQKYS
jgi:hypothetical protein